MAAAADLTLKNNAASNVTFNVYSVNPDSVEWIESGATSILGTSRAALSRKIPSDKANGVYRIGGRLTRPVINGTTGALDGTVTVPSRSFARLSWRRLKSMNWLPALKSWCPRPLSRRPPNPARSPPNHRKQKP